MQSKKILILTTAIFFTPLLTSASGLSVSPTRLDFTIKDKFSQIQEIIVANPTAETVVIEVYSDDSSGLIICAPKFFILTSGGRKIVSVSLAQKNILTFRQNNNISANLSVVAKPLNGGNFSIASGVKLPVNIKIIQNNQPSRRNQIIGLSALLFLIAAWIWKIHGNKK